MKIKFDFNKPTMFMMVGLPGSGKSTFIKNNLAGYPYISSDYYLEKWAKEENTTYNEIFKSRIKDAHDEMDKDLELMLAMNKHFVWDQTNINISTRKRKLARIPDNWYKVAIVMETDLDLCIERNENRLRSIPNNVIRSMMANSFQCPTVSEGFDQVFFSDNEIFD